MLRNLMALAMALVTTVGYLPSVRASETQNDKDAKRAKKVKNLIGELGVGPDSQIDIELKDGTRLKGYVSEKADDHFVITARDTGEKTNVNYDQVAKVRLWSLLKTGIRQKASSPKSFLKQVGIATAVGVGVLFAACLITRRCEE